MGGPAWLGGMALATAGCVYAAALAAVRGRESRWIGYARDGVNMLGFLMFSAGFWFLGLPGPHALLAGAIMALFGYGLDYALRGRPRPGLTLGIILCASAAAAALLREPIGRGLRGVMRVLF